ESGRGRPVSKTPTSPPSKNKTPFQPITPPRVRFWGRGALKKQPPSVFKKLISPPQKKPVYLVGRPFI
ncbi:hypothetical protein ACVGV8_14945, partial [Enterobacter intestinihominis]